MAACNGIGQSRFLESIYNLSHTIHMSGDVSFVPFVFWDNCVIPFNERLTARQLGFSGTLAEHVDALGASHTVRMQAIRKQLEGADSASFYFQRLVAPHEELICLVLGLLPASASCEVTFAFALGGVDGNADWSFLATTLAQLNITTLTVNKDTPSNLVSAAITPALTSLTIVGEPQAVNWQPLQRCPLAYLLLKAGVCQGVFDNIPAPLTTLCLRQSLHVQGTTLVISSQAVDAFTSLTLDDWYVSTTLPPSARATRSISYPNSQENLPSLLNIHVLLLHCNRQSANYPNRLNGALAVVLHESGSQPPQASIYPEVQAVRNDARRLDRSTAISQLRALERSDAWFRTFPEASVVLLRISFRAAAGWRAPLVPTILLHNPSSPIGVHHYGSICRIIPTVRSDRRRRWQRKLLPLLELVVTIHALGEEPPDNILSSVFRALLLSEYSTVEHARRLLA